MGGQGSQCVAVEEVIEQKKSEFVRALNEIRISKRFEVASDLPKITSDIVNFVLVVKDAPVCGCVWELLGFSVCLAHARDLSYKVWEGAILKDFAHFRFAVIAVDAVTANYVSYFLNKAKVFIDRMEFVERLVMLHESPAKDLRKFCIGYRDVPNRKTLAEPPKPRLVNPTMAKVEPPSKLGNPAYTAFRMYRQFRSVGTFQSSDIFQSELSGNFGAGKGAPSGPVPRNGDESDSASFVDEQVNNVMEIGMGMLTPQQVENFQLSSSSRPARRVVRRRNQKKAESEAGEAVKRVGEDSETKRKTPQSRRVVRKVKARDIDVSSDVIRKIDEKAMSSGGKPRKLVRKATPDGKSSGKISRKPTPEKLSSGTGGSSAKKRQLSRSASPELLSSAKLSEGKFSTPVLSSSGPVRRGKFNKTPDMSSSSKPKKAKRDRTPEGLSSGTGIKRTPDMSSSSKPKRIVRKRTPEMLSSGAVEKRGLDMSSSGKVKRAKRDGTPEMLSSGVVQKRRLKKTPDMSSSAGPKRKRTPEMMSSGGIRKRPLHKTPDMSSSSKPPTRKSTPEKRQKDSQQSTKLKIEQQRRSPTPEAPPSKRQSNLVRKDPLKDRRSSPQSVHEKKRQSSPSSKSVSAFSHVGSQKSPKKLLDSDDECHLRVIHLPKEVLPEEPPKRATPPPPPPPAPHAVHHAARRPVRSSGKAPKRSQKAPARRKPFIPPLPLLDVHQSSSDDILSESL